MVCYSMNDCMKQKVYIFSESCDGSYYYRGEVFKRFSTQYNVITNVDFENNIARDSALEVSRMFASDLIIFLRPTNKKNIALLNFLKKYGKFVVVDCDDSFSNIEEKNPAAYLLVNAVEHHKKFLSEAQGLIVSTDYLKNNLRFSNGNINVVSNYIDFQYFSAQYNRHESNDVTRILISGSNVTNENLDDFIDILIKIKQEYKNIEFMFFGGDDTLKKQLNLILGNNTIFVPGVSIFEYSKKLAGLNVDICLIPRKDNIFNRCKSNCKYLEMSALKIPVIAQRFSSGDSPYENDIKDGENGFLALTKEEWYRKLTFLINDKALRDTMGNCAYNYVNDCYDISKNVWKWEDIISSFLVGGKCSYSMPDTVEILNSFQKYLDDFSNDNGYLLDIIEKNDAMIIAKDELIKKSEEMILERDAYIKELESKILETSGSKNQ